MRAERSSTIGTERLTNYALQIKSRDEFISSLTSNLPARPEYFLEDAAINRAGAPSLADLPRLTPIPATELKDMIERSAIALDVRPAEQFRRCRCSRLHQYSALRSVCFLGGSGSWYYMRRPILIGETPEQFSEARMRLARVGIEDLLGYLEGGVEGWKRAGFPLAPVQQITVQELSTRLQSGGLQVLDVRREGEWQAGHIDGVDWYPLDRFKAALPQLERNLPIAVHCKSGYRSMIACSLLQRAGYNVINVIGGFDAWEQAKLPVASAAAVGA